MNRTKTLILGVILAVSVLSGCASTGGFSPARVYQVQQDAFITTAQSLLSAYQAKLFTEAEWYGEIIPLLVATNDLLDQLDALVVTDAPETAIREQLLRLQSMLYLLQPFLER